MQGTKVPISVLRQWAGAIFDAVEARGITEVELDDRGYWRLDSAEVWESRPPEPLRGDLADDALDLQQDLAEDLDARATIAWHSVDHFLGVLTRLSAELKGCDVDGQEDR